MTRLVRLDAGNVTYLPPGVAESLAGGGLVVFPTDTLYGLGANPRSPEGMAKLLHAKRRDRGKPIPLLLDEASRVDEWAADVPPAAHRLMDRFWPGALTIVLPASHEVPGAVLGAGGDTVGLRVPDHPLPRALARAVGGAVTGTSANRTDNPGAWDSPEQILHEFTGEVDWIVWDGLPKGAAAGPLRASTVVRVAGEQVTLLRDGALPFPDILQFLGKG